MFFRLDPKLTGLQLARLQFLENGIEALEVALPKTPESLHPNFKLLQRRWPQRINPALGVHANVHQSGITEHPQVFRDLRLAETELIDHVPNRPRSVKEQFDDLKTIRLGQRSECFHHGESEYASTRIFLSRHILVGEYKKLAFWQPTARRKM
jgi:hypothetical protein